MSSPSLTIDDRGIAWITFDDPNAKVNVLNPEVMKRLDEIVREVTPKQLVAIVFCSAKPDTFIAGADIKELAKISSPEQARELCRYGQKIFQAIARIETPTIALINGACLGGGCELALACKIRIASDNPKTQIGLPETLLGIVPGWGGTQRLPRLVGIREALNIICAGRALRPSQAKRVGLVDEIVPAPLLKSSVEKFAGANPTRGDFDFQNSWLVRTIICSMARKQTLAKTHGHYPAPLRAIDAVEQGLATWIQRGLEIEADIFSELATTETCKNLIRVFFLREGAKKISVPSPALAVEGKPSREAGRVTNIGVLGGGVMGAGIAQWFSARGLDVRLRDVKPEFVSAGLGRITSTYQEGVKRKKLTEADARRGMARISTTTDWTGFSGCDLIVEAIIEDEKIKKEAFAQLEAVAKPDAIFTTNTSAIPISHLAKALKNPSRMIGLHFFNPVSKMPLVEVVVGEQSSSNAVATGLELVKRIGKIPVVVKDRPGFLVNRVLIPSLNEAGWLLMEGNSVEAIDRALLDFGLPMGALRLVDEVGIDVGYYVAKELADGYGDRMKVAPILKALHERGLKGRKGGKGFYIYDHDNRSGVNDDIANPLREVSENMPQRETTTETIVHRCISVMINEAARCLEEGIVASADDIDRAMVMGTGFPPFRGGLMKYADSLGAAKWVEILQRLEKEVGPRFAPAPLLMEMAKTGKKFCAS